MEQKKPKNYLNNRDLYDELMKCQQDGVISNKLGKMFMLISEKYTNHRYFVQYPYKEDLASIGAVACCNAYMKFDPKRGSNPFAFFSSTVYYAFLQHIKKEYRQKDIKDQILVDNDLNPSYGYEERYDAERNEKLVKERENASTVEDEENLKEAPNPEEPDNVESDTDW